MATATNDRAELFGLLYRDRRRAHEVLFAHRHKDATPEFHGRIIDRLHSTTPLTSIVAFRGGAKSTLVEEAAVIQVGFRDFHNGLILGASLVLACQRLHAVRREIEKNKKLKSLFGELRGQPWSDEKLEFSNGVTLTAMGKGQALRGSKDEIFRPDFVIADDIEDKESVRTPEGREKIQSWFLGEVLPAMDTHGRCIVLANILDAECLAEKLKAKDSGFVVETYPWEYRDDAGERQPTWPARFPLDRIDATQKRYYALGRAREYLMEFMCVATAERDKPFQQAMKRVEPRVRTWEAVYGMYDPARTVRRGSAHTGYCYWSWIGPRLVVWEAGVEHWMPDQIISHAFAMGDKYAPVKIGIEEDGLNEWLLQPIRSEQVRRGFVLPTVPIRAPQGKIDFIKALQPYFNGREVWFTQDFHELWAQFLSFPTGNIDGPNALAYALHPKLKPGIAVYQDFTLENAAAELSASARHPSWLALNTSGSITTAVLAQVIDGAVRIYADWVREGDPDATLGPIIREAQLEAQSSDIRLVAGPLHFDRYNNLGLAQAARRLPKELVRGTDEHRGRAELRSLLRTKARGMPALLTASRARWTLNSFAGGYCQQMNRQGQLSDFAEEGPYRTLMEGLESFAGKLHIGLDEANEMPTNAKTSDGRGFFSARPQR